MNLKIAFTLVLLFLLACQSKTKEDLAPPNVLFIMVDDLRPELGCYGHAQIHSPNIDGLAKEATLFQRAYCNIPVCGASRASVLTGLRPTRNRFLSYKTWTQEDAPNATCLPQHFKNNGYYTISNGKIFHHLKDRSESWNELWRPAHTTSWRDYQVTENIVLDTSNNGTRGPAYEMAVLPDTAYFDGKIAAKTVEDLKKLKALNQPFFLAVGFLKPHLPFNAPKKYWDLYEYEKIQLPTNPFPPENAPKESIHNWGELRNYGSIPGKGPLSDSLAQKLIQGYYASVSYADAQIGKVLQALEALEMDKNTIVVLCGDHGWNLREHGLWCKHSNYRTSLRSTLIVKSPARTSGQKSNALVEFVDIYPTICELSGLESLPNLEGKSFVPLLDQPDLNWKDFVISKWYNGVTLKTDQYAYTEWSTEADSIYAQMLFDHNIDLEENVNMSTSIENEALIKKLSDQLHKNRGKDFQQ